MTAEIEAQALAAFLMQYLGLGVVFVLGMIIAWRQGDVGLSTPRQRRWLAVLVGGYVFYALLHGLLQFVAPYV